MKTIYKYPISPSAKEISLPAGAQILSCQVQHGDPQLWVLVDTEETHAEVRQIRIYGTGHPVQGEDLTFVDTFQLLNGSLIFHVFEECRR